MKPMDDKANLARTPKYSEHHLFWPEDKYQHYPSRDFRNHPFNRIIISEDTHHLIHETQDPPLKPTDKEIIEFLKKHPFSTESNQDEPPPNGTLKGVKILFQDHSNKELIEEVIYVRCENCNGNNCFSPLVSRYKQRTRRKPRPHANNSPS